jgi:hypothetical protein
MRRAVPRVIRCRWRGTDQNIVKGVGCTSGEVPPCPVHGHAVNPGIFKLLGAPLCRQCLPVITQVLCVMGHRGMHVQQGTISVENDRFELPLNHGIVPAPHCSRPQSRRVPVRPRGLRSILSNGVSPYALTVKEIDVVGTR